MTEVKDNHSVDYDSSIKKINLLEKEELEKFGQKVDEEGNITIPEKKKSKRKRFKLLVALAFLGASLIVGPDSRVDKAEEESRIELVSEEISGFDNLSTISVTSETDFNQKLNDFRDRFDFEIVETNNESLEHVENLKNDDYAINYLLDRIFTDLREQSQISLEIINRNNDANEELTESFSISDVMTDMYFRRDNLGNPVVGVYFNPDVISNIIQESGDLYFNLDIPVGWMEYSTMTAETQYPDLFSYTANGVEVFSLDNNLTIETNEDGMEVLMEESFEVVDISTYSDEDRAMFLVEEVDSWSVEEYNFLLAQEVIEEEHGYWYEHDEVYYNDKTLFNYGPGFDHPVRSGTLSSEFNIPIKRSVSSYSVEQALIISSDGLEVLFGTPRDRRVQSYQEGAIFYPNGEEFTSLNNQELIFQVANDNQEVTITLSAGDTDIVLDAEGKPDNLIVVGLYQRGMSPEGADYYMDPDENITSSASVATTLSVNLVRANPQDITSFLAANSIDDYVWRGSDNQAYEEEVKILNFE